jgi:hypothetical protein
MRMLLAAPGWPAIDSEYWPSSPLITLTSTPAALKAAAMPSSVLLLESMVTVLLATAPLTKPFSPPAVPKSILTVVVRRRRSCRWMMRSVAGQELALRQLLHVERIGAALAEPVEVAVSTVLAELAALVLRPLPTRPAAIDWKLASALFSCPKRGQLGLVLGNRSIEFWQRFGLRAMPARRGCRRPLKPACW